RKKDLTESQREAIIYSHWHRDSLRTIAAAVGCSKSSMWNVIKKFSRSGAELLVSNTNTKKRYEWALAHQDWTVDNFKRVLWSDKTTIYLFQGSPGHVPGSLDEPDALAKKAWNDIPPELI
ncbi:10769_t:CDS:2, partial [Dentiscutata heterogama]